MKATLLSLSRTFNTCTPNRGIIPLPLKRLPPLLQRTPFRSLPITRCRIVTSYPPIRQQYFYYTGQSARHIDHRKKNEEEKGTTRVEEGAVGKKENIYTIPNLVTLSRILCCPILSYTIMNDLHWITSSVLFYCATSDWLDGKLARMFPHTMATVLGSILDPAADKILMTTLVVSLSLKSLLPLPLAVLIIARDVLLSISSFYFRYKSLPIPKTFARFWDLSLPSAQVKPTLISKYNTFLQLLLVGLTTITPMVSIDTSTPLFMLQWIVAMTTISSGLSYVFSKNAIKYIH